MKHDSLRVRNKQSHCQGFKQKMSFDLIANLSIIVDCGLFCHQIGASRQIGNFHLPQGLGIEHLNIFEFTTIWLNEPGL